MHQKLFDYAKQSATDAFKTTSKRAIQETGEATVYLIGDKIANKNTEVSENSRQNNSETFEYENNIEISKQRLFIQKKDTKLLMKWY